MSFCAARLSNCFINVSGIRILGIENQSNVHYAMPVRNMLYDAMQFSSQVEASALSHRKEHDNKPTADEFLSGWYKEDRLLPVITLVIYFGANK